MAKITKMNFKNAVVGSAGILSNIAKRLNVTRSAVTQYVARNPDVLELLKEEDEGINDLAEVKLINKINDGDMRAIRFRLRTKAKHRGYIETQNINTNVKAEITANDFMQAWEEFQNEE
jgi:predicted transcriptional regulator